MDTRQPSDAGVQRLVGRLSRTQGLHNFRIHPQRATLPILYWCAREHMQVYKIDAMEISILFRFKIAVYDTKAVNMVQRQRQLSQIKLYVFFSKHDLGRVKKAHR